MLEISCLLYLMLNRPIREQMSRAALQTVCPAVSLRLISLVNYQRKRKTESPSRSPYPQVSVSEWHTLISSWYWCSDVNNVLCWADTDGLISQALLVGNFEAAVELCLNDGRFAEAILLSISGGEELLKKTQQRYLHQQTNSISMVTAHNPYHLYMMPL